jgi:hypothetical protein
MDLILRLGDRAKKFLFYKHEIRPTERGGFEPPMALTITVFETVAFNHSATSPAFGQTESSILTA